jgi:hypothetical protein
MQGRWRRSEGSGSFLKKRTKKLLPLCTVASPGAKGESLFASFSSEKEVSYWHSILCTAPGIATPASFRPQVTVQFSAMSGTGTSRYMRVPW